MNSLVTTLAPLYMIGSSSFLQVTRTIIKSRMGSTFCLIRPPAAELAALECQEKFPSVLDLGLISIGSRGPRASTKVESHVNFTESQKVSQPNFLQY